MRILLRAPTSPDEVEPATVVLDRRLLAGNTGNLVFLHASHRLLARPDVEITVDRLRIEPDDADVINATYDCYVVPFADAFRPTYEAKLIRWTELIRRLRIPVVILSVGARSTDDYDLAPMKPLDSTVRRFVAAALDHGPSIGVRGEFTDHYLRYLGFRDVEVIGCPSMFVHGPVLDVVKRGLRLDDRDPIAINASYGLPEMGRVVERASARYPNLVYVAQDADEVRWLVRGGRSRMDPPPGFPDAPEHRLVTAGRVRAFTHPVPWIRYLARQSFVFGTRIHGNITGLIAGTPSFVLSHDSRTLELARYHEIPHLPLAEAGQDADPQTLYERADYTALNAGHGARWSAFTSFLARHGLSTVDVGGLSSPLADEAVDLGPAVIDGASGVAINRRRNSFRGRVRRRLRRSPLRRLAGVVERESGAPSAGNSQASR